MVPKRDRRVDPETDGDQCLTTHDFFQLLRRQHGHVKLCLLVKAQRLINLEEPEAPDQELARGLSIPLAEVLTSYTLSSKMRLVLGYTLARSTWQYYLSPWTEAIWSTQTIHFMPEMTGDADEVPSITCRPCFSVRFGASSKAIAECYDSPNISHKYPRILSLGTLLVKLGYDHQRQAARQTEEVLTDTQRINNECTAGLKAGKDPEWPEVGLRDGPAAALNKLYKDATMACFDKSLFKPVCDR